MKKGQPRRKKGGNHLQAIVDLNRREGSYALIG